MEENESLNIAIIDDNEGDIIIIKKHLQKYFPNAAFVTADSKKAFEEKIQWMEPHIVLSDYNLPDCTGLDLLLYTKQHYPSVPFVFITGMLNDEEKTAEVILNGANGYILKQNVSTVGPKVADTLFKNKAMVSENDLKRRKMDELSMGIDKLKQYITDQKDHSELLKIVTELESGIQFLKF
ncbi:MAG: response regulator [Saprospiraceae bacterium]|nr:response regulator [Saprospiraceae bacterium]HMS70362.1 response regulator [Saprospiraceae bacterium]